MLQLLLIRECKGINRTEQSGDSQEQYGGSYVSLKCADEESNQNKKIGQQNSKPRPSVSMYRSHTAAAAAAGHSGSTAEAAALPAARSVGLASNFGESPPAAPHQFEKSFFFFVKSRSKA